MTKTDTQIKYTEGKNYIIDKGKPNAGKVKLKEVLNHRMGKIIDFDSNEEWTILLTRLTDIVKNEKQQIRQ